MKKVRHHWSGKAKKSWARLLSVVLAAMLVFTLAPLTPLEKARADGADETTQVQQENGGEDVSSDQTDGEESVLTQPQLYKEIQAEEKAEEKKEEEKKAEPVYKLEDKADDYVITADSKDGFAEGTTIHSKEITNKDEKNNKAEAAEAALKETNEKAEIKDSRFYDISFTDADGKDLQPEVTVTIDPADDLQVSDEESVRIAHISDNGKTEILDDRDAKTDATISGNALKKISFQADRFSVYGILVVGEEKIEEKEETKTDASDQKEDSDKDKQQEVKEENQKDVSAEEQNNNESQNTDVQTDAQDNDSQANAQNAKNGEQTNGADVQNNEQTNEASAQNGGQINGTNAQNGGQINGTNAQNGGQINGTDAQNGEQINGTNTQNNEQVNATNQTNAGDDAITGIPAVDHPAFEGVPTTDTAAETADTANETDKTAVTENADKPAETPETNQDKEEQTKPANEQEDQQDNEQQNEGQQNGEQQEEVTVPLPGTTDFLYKEDTQKLDEANQNNNEENKEDKEQTGTEENKGNEEKQETEDNDLPYEAVTDSYDVKVTPESAFENGTTFDAKEITEKDNADSYRVYSNAAKNNLENDKTVVKTSRFFKLSFTKDGKEVQPKTTPVTVSVDNLSGIEVGSSDSVKVLHITDEGTTEILGDEKVIASVENGKLTGVTFAADTFSVYGIAVVEDSTADDSEQGSSYTENSLGTDEGTKDGDGSYTENASAKAKANLPGLKDNLGLTNPSILNNTSSTDTSVAQDGTYSTEVPVYSKNGSQAYTITLELVVSGGKITSGSVTPIYSGKEATAWYSFWLNVNGRTASLAGLAGMDNDSSVTTGSQSIDAVSSASTGGSKTSSSSSAAYTVDFVSAAKTIISNAPKTTSGSSTTTVVDGTYKGSAQVTNSQGTTTYTLGVIVTVSGGKITAVENDTDVTKSTTEGYTGDWSGMLSTDGDKHQLDRYIGQDAKVSTVDAVSGATVIGGSESGYAACVRNAISNALSNGATSDDSGNSGDSGNTQNADYTVEVGSSIKIEGSWGYSFYNTQSYNYWFFGDDSNYSDPSSDYVNLSWGTGSDPGSTVTVTGTSATSEPITLKHNYMNSSGSYALETFTIAVTEAKSIATAGTSTNDADKIAVKKEWSGTTPASGTTVTASVRNTTDNTSTNVTLSSSNNWTATVDAENGDTYTVVEKSVTDSSNKDISSSYNGTISGPVKTTDGSGNTTYTKYSYTSSTTGADFYSAVSTGNIYYLSGGTYYQVSYDTSYSNTRYARYKYGSSTFYTASNSSSYGFSAYSDSGVPDKLYVKSGGSTTTETYTITNTSSGGSKTASSITASPASVSVTEGASQTVTLTLTGCAISSAVSGNSGIAMVSRSGNTLTITGVTAGSTSITVKGTAEDGYSAPASITIPVNVTDSGEQTVSMSADKTTVEVEVGSSITVDLTTNNCTATQAESAEPAIATASLDGNNAAKANVLAVEPTLYALEDISLFSTPLLKAPAANSGQTVTIAGVKEGETTVAVSGTGDEGFDAPKDLTINVKVVAAASEEVHTTTKGSGSVVVKKAWANEDDKTDSVTVKVGEQEVTLSDDNDWTQTVTGLAEADSYDITESAVSKNGEDVSSQFNKRIAQTDLISNLPTGGNGSYTISGGNYYYTYDNATRANYDSTTGRAVYEVSNQTFNGDVYIESNVTVIFTNCSFRGSVYPADSSAIASFDGTANAFYTSAGAGVMRMTQSGNVFGQRTVNTQISDSDNMYVIFPEQMRIGGNSYNLNSRTSYIERPSWASVSSSSANISGSSASYRKWTVTGTTPSQAGMQLFLLHLNYTSDYGYGTYNLTVPMYLQVGDVDVKTATTVPVYTITNIKKADLTHTITGTAGENGTLKLGGSDGKTVSARSTDTAQAADGKDFVVNINPNSGYEVDKIIVDGTEINPTDKSSYTFRNVKNDHEIAVTFKKTDTTTTNSGTTTKVSSISVEKKWEGGDAPTSGSVSVQLHQQGNSSTLETITLSPSSDADKNWKGTFTTTINPSNTYYVTESGATDGNGNSTLGNYTVSYAKDETPGTSGPEAGEAGSETTGKTYVFVYKSGNNYYALSGSGSTVTGTLLGTSVTLPSTIPRSMKWTYENRSGSIISQGYTALKNVGTGTYLGMTYNAPQLSSSDLVTMYTVTFDSNGRIHVGTSYNYCLTGTGTTISNSGSTSSGTSFTPYEVDPDDSSSSSGGTTSGGSTKYTITNTMKTETSDPVTEEGVPEHHKGLSGTGTDEDPYNLSLNFTGVEKTTTTTTTGQGGTSTSYNPANVVLLLDFSYSISGRQSNVIQSAQDFVDELAKYNSDSKVAVVAYGQKGYDSSHSGTSHNVTTLSGWTSLTSSGVSSLKSAISSGNTSSVVDNYDYYTNHGGGYSAAQSLLSGVSGHKYIVNISDGDFDYPGQEDSLPTSLASTLRSDGTSIYYLYWTTTRSNTSQMAQLTGSSSHVYNAGSSAENLGTVIANVEKEIRTDTGSSTTKTVTSTVKMSEATITDTLSDYVDFTQSSGKYGVTVTKKNGSTTSSLSSDDYSVAVSGKVITISINGNIDKDDVYTATFPIKVNTVAQETANRNKANGDESFTFNTNSSTPADVRLDYKFGDDDQTTNYNENPEIKLDAEPDYTVTGTVRNGTMTIDGKDVTTLDGGKVTVKKGASVTVNYQPNDGYYLSSITVNGNTQTVTDSNRTSWTFSNIQEDQTIAVVYAQSSNTETTEGTTFTFPTTGANQWQMVNGQYAGNSSGYKTTVSDDGNVRVQKNVVPTDTENEFLVYLSIDTKSTSKDITEVIGAHLNTAAYVGKTPSKFDSGSEGGYWASTGEPTGGDLTVKVDPNASLKKGQVEDVKIAYNGKTFGTYRLSASSSNGVMYLPVHDATGNITGYINIFNFKDHRNDSTTPIITLSETAYNELVQEVQRTNTSVTSVTLGNVTDTLGSNFSYEGVYVNSSNERCVDENSSDPVSESNGVITWTPKEKNDYGTIVTTETNGNSTTTTTWKTNVAELVYKVKFTPTVSTGVGSDGKVIKIDDASLYTNNDKAKAEVNSSATLSYKVGNDNGSVTFPKPEVRGIFHDIVFTKVDENGDPLEGVTFKLTGTTGNGDTVSEKTVTTGEDGVVRFTDLIYGNYTVTEISGKTGYEMDSTPINVQIDGNAPVAPDQVYEYGKGLVDGDTYDYVVLGMDTPDHSDNVLKKLANFENKKGDTPLTGIMNSRDGCTILVTILALAALAGTGFYMRRRRRRV